MTLRSTCLLTFLFALLFHPTTNAQNALNLDGVDDYVQTTFGGIQGNTARTVEAMIRTTANANPNNGGVQQIITDWGSNSTGARFTFNVLWNDAIRLEVNGNGVSGTIPVNDGMWHHVAVVFDQSASNEVSLYVDGVLDVAGNLTVGVNTGSTVPMRIGNRIDGARYFEGDIDEVRVWNTPLTQSQLQANMNDELCNLNNNLLAYYTFDQGIANGMNTGLTNLMDDSGNGGNGTLLTFGLSGTTSNWVTGAGLGPGFSVGDTTISTCQSFNWADNGNTYTNSGTYSATIQNSLGCDSIVTLNLTILPAVATSISDSSCTPYFWATSGQTFGVSGSYSHTLQAANGCDSVITLNLVVGSTTSSNEVVTGCNSYTWSANGITYTSSAIQFTVLTNSQGCDSITGLDLTIVSYDTTVTQTSPTTLSSNQPVGNYQWLDCDNGYAVIPGATSSSFLPTGSGSYAVEISIGGCTDTTACTYFSPVGMGEIERSLLQIIPNPSEGQFQVLNQSGQAGIMQLFDPQGRLIESRNLPALSQHTVSLDAEAQGVYLVQMQTAEGRSVQRVVIY